MVWVSNRANQKIYISITNKTGGSADAYTVIPQSTQNESVGKNLWKRSGQETVAILREGGKEQSFEVGPSDFIRVYSDAVIISQANVLVA